MKQRDIQVSRLSSIHIDIIFVYRSASCQNAFNFISQLIVHEKTTIICGDFNVCFIKKKSNTLIQSLLRLGFAQRVNEATHFQGGLIDHAYHRNGITEFEVEVNLYSPYYTAFDHDALCIIMKKKNMS